MISSHPCQQCGKETTNPKFCSRSCRAKTINKTRILPKELYKRTKTLCCVTCKTPTVVFVNTSPTKVFCDVCKIKKSKRKCKSCGADDCKTYDICKHLKLIPTLIKYFNFEESWIGTSLFPVKYKQIQENLNFQYHTQKLSIPELCEYYHHPNIRNFWKILKSLGVSTRTFSESNLNSLETGRKTISEEFFNPKYKHGWHETWNSKKVFYRSSYELNYCKILDEQKIDYVMEKLRICYFDSILQKERIAIPDYYIPSENLIIEIKSTYTLNLQNTKDKVKSYLKKGYKFKLILEGKETDIHLL